jgi:hypothetical protein
MNRAAARQSVGLLRAGQVIRPGLSRPEACPGRYLAVLRYARGGGTVTAGRRRTGPVDSDVTPGSGHSHVARSQRPGSVRK